jgi:hypothetical protein
MGAAIGTGASDGGTQKVGNVTISNSTVLDARSSNCAAIGSGGGISEVSFLMFSGFCFIRFNGSGMNHAIHASLICFSDASLTFVTENIPLFGTTPSKIGWLELVICYHSVTPDGSEPLSLLDDAFVHISNISVPAPQSGLSQFCILREDIEYCLDDRTGRIQSLIVKRMGHGDYSFRVWIDNNSYVLRTLDDRTSFGVDVNVNCTFIDVLVLGGLWPTNKFRATGNLNSSPGLDATVRPSIRHGFMPPDTRRNRVRLVQ